MRRDPEFAASFGKRLKRILKEKGLTQKQVQEGTGISQQAISSWCRGSYMPRAAALSTLAEYLEMTQRSLCPEHFDALVLAEQPRLGRLTFGNIDRNPGWYKMQVNPPMLIDHQMLQDVLAAHDAFIKRTKKLDFQDVKLGVVPTSPLRDVKGEEE